MKKTIAQIDSQLSKAIVDNKKQISSIDAQLSQAQLTLQYQDIRSPVDGVVFDLQGGPGTVVNASEPVVKIVPSNSLIAKVYITNRDVGFIREGMEADVRIDSFPFTEFGQIHGQLYSLGSDALPPDPAKQLNTYTFPGKVILDQQFLKTQTGHQISLQSGMSVHVNLKIRDRTVMSIFIDQFTRNTEGLEHLR
ncbi:HlyD family secretion protein [Neosynechococcus sphagnicola]|uniref:HlyD family secretion protein n=1 Tax=Neosynechococcus sphagnicola TaxID=1501145 RepID=UPI00068DBC79|nr:HlyD family efflux transporter periplasmic adaptor subunit [Neosynechococcus sphagnicola]